jgi:hypothetical protein
MKALPLLNSFAAGEITPLLHMREDLPAIRHGAKTVENMIAVSHGAALSRKGTRLAAILANVSVASQFEFQYSKTLAFTIVVAWHATTPLIHVLDSSGLSIDIGNLVLNSVFAAGLSNWTSFGDQSYGVVAGDNSVTLNIDDGSANSNIVRCGIRQSVVIASTGSHRFRIRMGAIPTGTIFSKMHIHIGDSVDGNGLPSTEHLNVTITGNTFEILVYGMVGQTVHIGAYLESEVDKAGVGSRTIYEISMYDPTGAPNTLVHSFSVYAVRYMRAERVPNSNIMYLVSNYSAPYSITYTPSTNAWALTALTFTAKPGSWTTNNYPSCVTFFQGRSWWGGVPSLPETFWASKSGLPLDLTTGALADDAIEYSLDKSGAIHWIKGANSLVIGTSKNEFIVHAEGGLLMPGDIQAIPQSNSGSRNIDPLDLGNKIIFANLAGDKIHDMGYKWEEELWIPREISYVSEHIFKTEKPKCFAFMTTPIRMIVVLTETGKLYTCLYDDANNIIGWHRHPMSRIYSSMSVNTVNGISSLYLGYILTDTLYLEEFNADYCLDRYIVQHNTPASSAISAPHLAYRLVGIIADGVLHPDVTLDSSGNGTLNTEASVVVIGLKYIQKLVTLPGGIASAQGSGMATTKRWSKLFIRLYKSYIPKINGLRPRVARSDSNAFEVSGMLEDGFIEVSNFGYSRDGTVTIEQDDPFPICITGIYGELQQE